MEITKNHQYPDFSIHFDENSELDHINKLIDWFLGEYNKNCEFFDLSEPWEMEISPVLHHCFMPEREIGTKIYDDILYSLCETQICWYYSDGPSETGSIEQKHFGSAYAMLRNLTRLNGIALFFGDVSQGRVHCEFNTACKYTRGLRIIHIEDINKVTEYIGEVNR